MAYTTKEAIQTLNYYLQSAETHSQVIADTKDRGYVIELPNKEHVVIFVYPLVHKQDNTKNYFDTRDSGAYERGVAWKYAIHHDMKYFCLGINDQVPKYNEYVFSLECNESVIEDISGTKDGARNGPGNQIIIPNDYIPSLPFERIKNKLGIFISVVHMNALVDYLQKYDNRPYMAAEEFGHKNVEEINKELFREWLTKQVKPDGDSDAGNPYAESSINEYVNTVARQKALIDGQEKSLYASTNLKVIDEVYEVENQKPDTTNGRVKSAIKKYREYAQQLGTENEYERAAQILNNYVLETGLEFERSEDELNALIAEFNAKFSPEKLMQYSDDVLLESMFYTAAQTNDSMSYWLEFNKDMRSQFGSIAGGSSLKYGLYQSKEGEWITGSPANKEAIPYERALDIGKEIRDKLVRGAEIIQSSSLETLSDYEQLHDSLIEELGNFATNNWVHKYFYMIFPDKFTTYHSEDWQKHFLRALMISPSSKVYGRSGQLAIVARYAGRMVAHVGVIMSSKFGDIKQFCRLGTSDDDNNYAEEWREESIVAIGWQALGELTNYIQSTDYSGAKRAIAEKMHERYYPSDSSSATRKAGEVLTFYRSNEDTVFVMMDGERLLGLADDVGEYFFDGTSPMSHCKPATWHCCFELDDKLPKRAEGHMTSCFELKDDENLMYLYRKYYYELSDKEGEEEMTKTKEYVPPVYNTGILPVAERNRIVFGAPGTGKSWSLKNDSEELLKDTDGTLERVTFHPDYSYSQFVGTYKPVSDAKGDIRYEFVAGPFMRVYVQAIQSGRTENPQPHLLLIEEINRAKVAAVFGDVFQLLDRDDDGVSEYEIQTSKDVRKYLASELGGEPEQWDKIKLPDNMFIWATMNSADQGVFPMDTAFKRRWSFEYLGINESEDKRKREFEVGGETIDWNVLRRAINEKMSCKDFKINEDKLLGPYFIGKKILKYENETELTEEEEKQARNDHSLGGLIEDQEKFKKVFKSKVIMYLYEDAVKQRKDKFFEGCDSSKYSAVCEAFDEIGIRIFGNDFMERYYKVQEGQF